MVSCELARTWSEGGSAAADNQTGTKFTAATFPSRDDEIKHRRDHIDIQMMTARTGVMMT